MTAAGLALVILLATGDVRAESLRRWDAALRAGYGATWTTGIPYLGFGLGASAGYVFPRRLRIEGVLLWSAGQVQEASTTTLSYRSSQSSWRGTMGVFYELGRGSVRLRPGLQSGLTIITGSTRIGTSSVQDVDPRFLLGPALSAVVHVGRLELGIATEAFFLPSQPAAPSAGVYATTGWVF